MMGYHLVDWLTCNVDFARMPTRQYKPKIIKNSDSKHELSAILCCIFFLLSAFLLCSRTIMYILVNGYKLILYYLITCLKPGII